MSGLAYLAASYAAGVFLAPKLDVSYTVMFAAVYILICLIKRIAGRGVRLMTIAVTLMFCSGVILSFYYGAPTSDDVGKYDGMYVTLTGRICELPRTDYENNRYIVDVRRVTMNGDTEEVKAKMLITSPVYFHYGDTVDFTGFVSEIDGKLNERGFDLKRDYKSKGIFYRCFSSEPQLSDVKIRSYSVYSCAQSLKNIISRILDKYTSGDRQALLKAIITGENVRFSDDFEAVLARTGTTRFFYPAFMHIMLIIGFVGLFAGITKRKYRDAALVVLLILYAMAESSHPVFVKCSLIAAFLIIFRRRLGYIYFPDVLGAAVLTVGISNPLLFYNAGFVTGVTASLLISMFYRPVSRKIRVKNRIVKRAFVTGAICSVGLLPLYALYFHGITSYSIFYALIFLSDTFVIILLSPLLIIMLALFGTAPVVGQIITAMLWIYMKLPYLIDAMPYSHIALPAVGALTIIAFYTAVYGAHLIYRNRKYNGFLALCAAAAFAAVIIIGEIPRFSQADFIFVNVGQGDGALIRLPYRNTVLIDGGGGNDYSEYDPGKSIYLPYLESLGISDVDCAIISHCHSDHAGGIIAAIKNMRVRHVYLPETSADNDVYRELVIAAEKYGSQIHTVTEPTTLRFKSGLVITMRPPGENALLSADENDRSLLIRASYFGTDCCYTGDMPKAEEFGLLAEGDVMPSEILKIAHHGSDSSSSKRFLDAVDPEYAVISAGEDNVYGLPSAAVLDRLGGVKVFRTDKNGDITFTADKRGALSVKTYK